MITEREFLERARLDRATLTIWIEEEWLIPGRAARELAFTEIDVARANLIHDLKDNMGVNDEGLGVILHLLDQMHALRRALADTLNSTRERRTPPGAADRGSRLPVGPLGLSRAGEAGRIADKSANLAKGEESMLLPTTLVGSYAQPEWLIDRAKLAGRFPPRVRAKELWRIPEPFLAEAQDDATVLAIRAQEDAGLDIITDGEIRRESYSNRFATALEGIDIDQPGVALDRSGHPNPVPRIVGKIRRKHPVEVGDLKFLRSHTTRKVKMTVPGPFTMSQQAQNDFYPTLADAALAYAEAVNAEIKDLFAAGADIVQIDEPYMQARPKPAGEYGLDALNRALEGVNGVTAVHICFGYAAIIHERPSAYSFLPQLKGCRCRQISIETAQSNLDCAVLEKLPDQTIILGVLDLSTPKVETPETVAERIRRALRHRKPEDIVVAPDCGLKYLPRDAAYGKMKAMVEGARIVRAELAKA